MVAPLRLKLLRDIRRQRAQFIAVAVTIFLGIWIFAASYDSFQNLQASYDQTFEEFRFANLTAAGGDVETIAATAAARPGVESVQTRTVLDPPIRVGEISLLGRVVGLPATGQPEVNQVEVLRGSYLDPARPDRVLVEEHMADHFDLAPGDPIEVFAGDGWTRLEVAGVISSPEYIWPARDRQNLITSPDNFGVVFAAEDTARTLAGAVGPGEVTIYYTDGAEDEALSAALTAAAREAGAISVYARAEQPSNLALSEDIKGLEETALFFPMLFLIASAMAAYVMISRLVYAQRPQIGVMLANGFTRGRVLRHYLGYGWVPGLIGAVPGAVVGVFTAGVITRLYTGLLSIPVTLVEFHPTTIVIGVVVGLLATLLAALAPALFASRVHPAEAMRGAVPAGRGRISLPERVVPPLRRLPVRWRMVLRGIERNPRRTLYTVLGVVLSVTLVLVSWGLIDTMERVFDLQFVEIERQDAAVHFTAPVGIEQVRDLEAVAGVAAAEPALTAPVLLSAGGESYETLLTVLEPGTGMHGFRSARGGWVDLPERGVLIGDGVAGLLGVEPGDRIEIEVVPLGRSFEAEIAGFVSEPLGTLAYTSWPDAESALGMPVPATSALLRYEPGADPAAVRGAVTGLPGVAAFEDSDAIYRTVQKYLVLFYAFVGVMLTFGGAMAFALIFNAMTVNIAERSREVATLLAVGTERRTISRLVTAENLLVTLAGIPIGLLAGYWVLGLAAGTWDTDLFTFDVFVRPATFLYIALAIVLVALISGWPGLRALRRLHIPTIVKERST